MVGAAVAISARRLRPVWALKGLGGGTTPALHMGIPLANGGIPELHTDHINSAMASLQRYNVGPLVYGGTSYTVWVSYIPYSHELPDPNSKRLSWDDRCSGLFQAAEVCTAVVHQRATFDGRTADACISEAVDQHSLVKSQVGQAIRLYHPHTCDG